MPKKSGVLFLAFFSSSTIAAVGVDLYHAPPSSIKQFFKSPAAPVTRKVISPPANVLEAISTVRVDNKTVVRYQQLYKGTWVCT